MPTLSEKVPLAQNKAGTFYIEGSRVFLEHLVGAFNSGKTPEEIHHDYPSLALDDIYAVITYYLRHRKEIDGYVAQQYERAEEARSRLERYAKPDLRERIKARMEG